MGVILKLRSEWMEIHDVVNLSYFLRVIPLIVKCLIDSIEHGSAIGEQFRGLVDTRSVNLFQEYAETYQLLHSYLIESARGLPREMSINKNPFPAPLSPFLTSSTYNYLLSSLPNPRLNTIQSIQTIKTTLNITITQASHVSNKDGYRCSLVLLRWRKWGTL